MTKAELLTQIRAKFIIKLNEKTGWGRKQVMEVYDECVREVFYKTLDNDYNTPNKDKEK